MNDRVATGLPKSILMIGVAGGLAQLTLRLIQSQYPGVDVLGVDTRDLSHLCPTALVRFQKISYSRSSFESLFRNQSFDIVLHLGRLSHVKSPANRKNINIVGTGLILELAQRFAIKRTIILSTYHVYGAFADNGIFLSEDSPLRASIKFPELHDVVEMDQMATGFMWKNQSKMETIVLRPCSIIGPRIKNAISRYLTLPYMPIPIDYNPMFQFIYESDMAKIISYCMLHVPTGVYNVAPSNTISLGDAKKLGGKPTVPTSLFLLGLTADLINRSLWRIPHYLLDYLKFPCIIETANLDHYLPKGFLHHCSRNAVAKTLSLAM